MKLPSVLLLTINLIFVAADILVDIPDGTIQGREEYSDRGKTFYSFQQIPYAKPPLGELRFKGPEPVEKWDGILNATANTKVCVQVHSKDKETAAMENEDCLYLNVYTPRYPSSDTSLPVMFFFYGGGFILGSATLNSFGPHYLMENDVIVVSVNYRLGAFGFLSTGDTVIPGNYGLKDQQMALRWVQQNIKYFGGDPEKVTIFGQSAGGASVCYHLMSKGSEGLFRAGIASSGSILSPFGYQRHYKDHAYKLASTIDPSFDRNSSSDELLKFLRSIPAADIQAATISSFPETIRNDGNLQGRLFTPVVEPEHETAFITEYMYAAIENGRMNRVPLMIGICSEEGLYRAKASTLNQNLKMIDDDPAILVNENMHLTDKNQLTSTGRVIRKLYTGGRMQDDPAAAIRFFTDTAFSRGIIRHAELQSYYSDVYFYEFAYHGKLGGNNGPFFEGADKVFHGEDKRYIWANNNVSDLNNFPQEDILMSEKYRALYTNFAKYLNPTPSKSDLLENIIWPKVEPGNFQYLNINNTLSIKKNPKAEVYSKWLDIYEELAVKPYDTF